MPDTDIPFTATLERKKEREGFYEFGGMIPHEITSGSERGNTRNEGRTQVVLAAEIRRRDRRAAWEVEEKQCDIN